jgi:hypothetical protein
MVSSGSCIGVRNHSTRARPQEQIPCDPGGTRRTASPAPNTDLYFGSAKYGVAPSGSGTLKTFSTIETAA